MEQDTDKPGKWPHCSLSGGELSSVSLSLLIHGSVCSEAVLAGTSDASLYRPRGVDMATACTPPPRSLRFHPRGRDLRGNRLAIPRICPCMVAETGSLGAVWEWSPRVSCPQKQSSNQRPRRSPAATECTCGSRSRAASQHRPPGCQGPRAEECLGMLDGGRAGMRVCSQWGTVGLKENSGPIRPCSLPGLC